MNVEFDTVTDCARCGGTHLVAFRPFTRPNPLYGEFGMCPTTAEPILVRYAVEYPDGPECIYPTRESALVGIRIWQSTTGSPDAASPEPTRKS